MSHIDILWTEHLSQTLASIEWIVMIDFWAAWCGPCRMLAPVLHQVVEQYAGKVHLVKVDIDADENQPLAIQYAISSIPRVLFFMKWEKIDDFVGVQWLDAVKSIIEKHLPKDSTNTVSVQ